MGIPQNNQKSAEPRDTYAVQVHKVTKYFNKVEVLKGITLNISDGEFVTLLGPSGCGKTTLLRIISGFERQDSGTVYIAGSLMDKVPPERRPVNMVFQSYALFPHKNVFENIAFGLRLKGIPNGEITERVNDALKMGRLEKFAHRQVAELSGGQAQRVAVARALVNRPRVLLLDEPLAALDLKLRKQMQFELRKIHQELGLTFVYVTHDQEEALTLSDRIVLMNQGEIAQEGTPEEIYKAPNSTFSAGFIGECNLIAVRLVETINSNKAVVDLFGQKLCAISKLNGVQAGSTVNLVIRLEKLKLARGNIPEKYQKIKGTIADVVFLGSVKIYRVLLESGPEIRTRDYMGLEEESFSNGENVWVCFRPEDALVLGE
ncbi:MAG: ABC transporter ATP-binding protein [Eubacteriales bacterium]